MLFQSNDSVLKAYDNTHARSGQAIGTSRSGHVVPRLIACYVLEDGHLTWIDRICRITFSQGYLIL